jgi:hypothetical protein
MKVMTLLAAGLLSLALASAEAAAQPAPAIPDQSWYPEGYRDLRIAAALQAQTFPRAEDLMVVEDFDDPRARTYDLIDCDPFYDVPEGLDEAEAERVQLALDMSKMRAELARIGYPREVYDQPLLDYERWMLTGVAPAWARRLLGLMDKYPEGEIEGFAGSEEEGLLLGNGTLGALKDELEARRTRLSPRLPRFVVEGGCGAGEEEFEIRLVPANGELWLINAFAFRVCERKVADPWNHRACGWTQYAAGDTTFASGRYMFEARWPDGTVRRGARVLQADFDSDEAGAVTFRR